MDGIVQDVVVLVMVLLSVVIPGFSFFSWISQISRGMLRFVIG